MQNRVIATPRTLHASSLSGIMATKPCVRSLNIASYCTMAELKFLGYILHCHGYILTLSKKSRPQPLPLKLGEGSMFMIYSFSDIKFYVKYTSQGYVYRVCMSAKGHSHFLFFS